MHTTAVLFLATVAVAQAYVAPAAFAPLGTAARVSAPPPLLSRPARAAPRTTRSCAGILCRRVAKKIVERLGGVCLACARIFIPTEINHAGGLVCFGSCTRRALCRGWPGLISDCTFGARPGAGQCAWAQRPLWQTACNFAPRYRQQPTTRGTPRSRRLSSRSTTLADGDRCLNPCVPTAGCVAAPDGAAHPGAVVGGEPSHAAHDALVVRDDAPRVQHRGHGRGHGGHLHEARAGLPQTLPKPQTLNPPETLHKPSTNQPSINLQQTLNKPSAINTQ